MSTSHAMHHADAAWLHMDRPTNLMIVTSALWTDEPLDEALLREVIQERLVDAYPRFRQRVVEGLTGPHWEDDPTFDLDLHMHHLALPHPGDRATLEAAVGDLMSQPLDRSRPLWAMYLLDGYGEGSATSNDVLVSCVAGAVRTYLQHAEVDPVDVHAMVPFNLRPLDQPLPRDLGNRFGLVLLDLPVGIEDPIRRLRESHTRMSAIKSSREGPMSYAILDVIGHTPPALEARIVDLFSAKATMVLTNVPGPRKPVYLAGSRLDGVLGWAPCSGAVGMSVSIFSYDGEVTVGFMINGRLVEDPRDLVTAFESAAGAVLGPAA